MRKDTIRLRVTKAEKERFRRLAKPYSLSEYIRQLLLKEEARRETEERLAKEG